MANVSSMADLGQEEARLIPLECVLCPKKPKFSDVSHLLTHISSKSHLHHKFNSEFQAKSDPSIRDKLRKYEQWYIENGVESLLHERLKAKDQKKGIRRGRQAASNVSLAHGGQAVAHVLSLTYYLLVDGTSCSQ